MIQALATAAWMHVALREFFLQEHLPYKVPIQVKACLFSAKLAEGLGDSGVQGGMSILNVSLPHLDNHQT